VILGVSLSCLASFGFLLNDIWDRKVDLLNNAQRLEHEESRVIAGAGYMGFMNLLLGLGLASILGTKGILLAVVISAGLVVYTTALRRIAFFSTLLASILSLSPLVSPFVLFGGTNDPFLFGVVCVSWAILFGREILLDLKDVDGDRQVNRRTLPVLMGEEPSAILGATVILGGAIVLVGLSIGTTTFGAAGLGIVVSVLLARDSLLLIFDRAGRRAPLLVFVRSSRLAMVVLSAALLLHAHGL
jgi:4-hydroxybenzoate polyprenyltransferase